MAFHEHMSLLLTSTCHDYSRARVLTSLLNFLPFALRPHLPSPPSFTALRLRPPHPPSHVYLFPHPLPSPSPFLSPLPFPLTPACLRRPLVTGAAPAALCHSWSASWNYSRTTSAGHGNYCSATRYCRTTSAGHANYCSATRYCMTTSAGHANYCTVTRYSALPLHSHQVRSTPMYRVQLCQ